MNQEADQKDDALHPHVVKLGFVSFLTDLSSEMIFSVFSIFFTTIAGASSALLGIIEGLADFSASSLNYLSGWLSDRTGRRKWFVVAGYGFSTLAKLILLFSSSIVGLSIFRVIERLGKGFRGPPRDAWLSSVAQSHRRGYAFGVHKALDKAGAVLGPLIAYVILSYCGESSQTFETLFIVAFIPAVLSVLFLLNLPDVPATPHPREDIFRNLQELSSQFKLYLIPSVIFSLSYFSLGFILLRAHELGFQLKEVVLLYALFSFICVISAPFIGTLGDWIGRRYIVPLGYIFYAGINVLMIYAEHAWQIILAFVLYGIFYAIDESQNKAFISDLEHHRRASAIGIYNFLTGIFYLPASLLAGLLWSVSPDLAFQASLILASLAFLGFMFLFFIKRA